MRNSIKTLSFAEKKSVKAFFLPHINFQHFFNHIAVQAKVYNSTSIIAPDCWRNKSTKLNYGKLIRHTPSTISAYQENNWKFLRVHPIRNWFHYGVLSSCMHICCCSYDKHEFNLSLEKYSEGIEFNEHSQVYGIVRIVISWIASTWDCL